MSVGAGIALSKLRDGLRGRIVVLGTPDEEGGGGKIAMVRGGVFDEIDAAMMVHPGSRDVKRARNLAAFMTDVEFHGKPAHAASKPFEGLNALDAMVQLFTNVGLLRQQLPDDVRIHGIITHGGVAPNVIPAYTKASFIIRASELGRSYDVLEQFKNCVKAAAVATGTSETVTVKDDHIYEPLMTNTVLMQLYAENMRLLEVEVEEQLPSELGGSSDIGNVSQVVPAIHPTGRIVDDGRQIPGHTYEFAIASRSEGARAGMMRGIQALAMCGVDLLGNPDLLHAVKEEFQRNTTKQQKPI
jgi:amidohydrolase